MAKTPEEGIQSLINNLPAKTGKSLEEWFKVIRTKKLTAYKEIMALLKSDFNVSHGFANQIALQYKKQSEGGRNGEADLVATQYAGAKAVLKPLYEEIVKTVRGFGTDVVVSPKKANVSLRRNKQFGLIQPGAKDRMDLGLILRGVPAKGRLEEGASWNGMCTHRVRLNSSKDFDKEVKSWLKKAYEQA